MIKEIFPNKTYETISAKIYDIVGIAKAVIDIIDKEKDKKIIVHISEGRKTMSLGLLFGSYVMKKFVDSAYYITEETNTPIQLPLMELKVSPKRRKILELIQEGHNEIEYLEKELKIFDHSSCLLIIISKAVLKPLKY